MAAKSVHRVIFMACGAVLGIVATVFMEFHPVPGNAFRSVFAPDEAVQMTVVIDPGHGGEDGGAVSPEGVEESGINLAVSQRVSNLLNFMGVRTVMTRTEDVSIGNPSLGSVKERKASDIRRRVEIVNGTDNAVLLSIHQNSLPSSPVTHGAQVFWNAQGEALAGSIQEALNVQINAGNEKKARPMGQGVYLMTHAQIPAALAECGFLSNFAETMQLLDPEYQKELSIALAAGCLRWMSEN